MKLFPSLAAEATMFLILLILLAALLSAVLLAVAPRFRSLRAASRRNQNHRNNA